MDVDTEISRVFRADEVELAVPVVVPPYLDRAVPLTERFICSAMEVETIDAAVLTRDEDSRPVDVAGVVEPIRTGIGRRRPCLATPANAYRPEYDADDIVEAIRHGIPRADAEDVEVVRMPVFEGGVTFAPHDIQDPPGFHVLVHGVDSI
jgi:hypothetical protein